MHLFKTYYLFIKLHYSNNVQALFKINSILERKIQSTRKSLKPKKRLYTENSHHESKPKTMEFREQTI